MVDMELLCTREGVGEDKEYGEGTASDKGYLWGNSIDK